MEYNNNYDYGEEFNIPETIKINVETYYKLKEKISYYETTIKMIEKAETLDEIKETIKELKEELK